MSFTDSYRRQVELLLRTIPHLAQEACFALKGGTAINLFIRDMPRLSIDIDLTYLPLDNNWSIFAAVNYSLEENLSVEDMIGVEYDTCCWTVRLLQLRYYNNVSGQVPNFSDPDLERVGIDLPLRRHDLDAAASRQRLCRPGR